MLGMDSEPGIYLQTLTDLFRAIEETRDTEYSVSMSYLEVSPPPPQVPFLQRKVGVSPPECPLAFADLSPQSSRALWDAEPSDL